MLLALIMYLQTQPNVIVWLLKDLSSTCFSKLLSGRIFKIRDHLSFLFSKSSEPHLYSIFQSSFKHFLLLPYASDAKNTMHLIYSETTEKWEMTRNHWIHRQAGESSPEKMTCGDKLSKSEGVKKSKWSQVQAWVNITILGTTVLIINVLLIWLLVNRHVLRLEFWLIRAEE